MRSLHKTVAAAALLVATGQAANAVQLSTPVAYAPNGRRLSCSIVNVGTGPIQVTGALRNFDDGKDITYLNYCPTPPSTLAPGAGCIIHGPLGPNGGYCQFNASSSRVRANLVLHDQLGWEILSVTATK